MFYESYLNFKDLFYMLANSRFNNLSGRGMMFLFLLFFCFKKTQTEIFDITQTIITFSKLIIIEYVPCLCLSPSGLLFVVGAMFGYL